MAELLRSITRLPCIAVLLLAITAAGSVMAQSSSNRIVRIVNDEAISTYDVNARLRFIAISSRTPLTGEAAARIRAQVIETLVDEELQLQEAKRLGIVVEDAEIQAAIRRIEEQNRLEPGGLLKILTRSNVDANTLIDQIRATLAWRNVVSQRLRSQVVISEDEVDEYLKSLREKGGTEYLLAEIFIAANTPSELPGAKETAENLLQQMRRGAQFAEMARQFSQAPTAGAGGDTGWVRADQLESALAEAIKQLRPGEITPPVGVSDGYYLVALRQSRTFGAEGQQETVYDMRRVLLPFPPGASEGRKREILIQLANARPSLNSCEAVEQYATRMGDPEKGDMGELRQSDLPPELRSYIVNLKPGQPSQLLRLQNGALVMMLCEKSTRSLGLPSRDEVRDNLLQREADIIARRYMRELRENAIIQTVEEPS